MSGSSAKQATNTKVLTVFSANTGDNMDIGQVKCLGERQ